MKPEEIKNKAFQLRIIRYQEKTITPAELQELNHELRNSEQRRTEFAQICETSRLIREASMVQVNEKKDRISRILLFPATVGWLKMGVAALLMISIGVFSFLKLNPSADGIVDGNVADTIAWGDSVVIVEELGSDTVCAGSNVTKQGDLLGKGWLRLQKGWVRLKFRSGAVVTLEAPASFGINSAMRSYLEYGKVDVYAPESARDFVVATKSMEVVDLGTRFELNVDAYSGESVVDVTEGLVDLHLGSRGTQRKIQPLEAGWKAEVDHAGTIVNMVEREAGARQGGEVLLAHWKLDEIANGGMLPDSGSNGMDALFRGDATAETSSGRVGNALDMGDEEYIDLSQHIQSVTSLDAFTLTAWIRDPNGSILFSVSDGSANNRIQFNLNNKHLVYLWQDQSSLWDSIAGSVDGWIPGQWYHVAVSVDSSGVRLYRDGKLLASGSTGIQIGTPCLGLTDIKNPQDMFLGHIREGTGGTAFKPQWFRGVMDDVQLYGNALNHSAIRELYVNPGEVLPRLTE